MRRGGRFEVHGYFGDQLRRALGDARIRTACGKDNPFSERSVRSADRKRYRVRPPCIGGAVDVRREEALVRRSQHVSLVGKRR